MLSLASGAGKQQIGDRESVWMSHSGRPSYASRNEKSGSEKANLNHADDVAVLQVDLGHFVGIAALMAALDGAYFYAPSRHAGPTLSASSVRLPVCERLRLW